VKTIPLPTVRFYFVVGFASGDSLPGSFASGESRPASFASGDSWPGPLANGDDCPESFAKGELPGDKANGDVCPTSFGLFGWASAGKVKATLAAAIMAMLKVDLIGVSPFRSICPGQRGDQCQVPRRKLRLVTGRGPNGCVTAK
jgi:hypothetical protein